MIFRRGLAALFVLLGMALPAHAQSPVAEPGGWAGMLRDGSNAKSAARVGIFPSPTANNCLVGNGTDWVTAPCVAVTVATAPYFQVTKTTNYSVQTTDVNTYFDNAGATAEVDFTLPAYGAALRYCFQVVTAQTVKIIVPTPAKIAIGAFNSLSGGNISANSTFSSVCINSSSVTNQWITTSSLGAWGVN